MLAAQGDLAGLEATVAMEGHRSGGAKAEDPTGLKARKDLTGRRAI